MVDCRHLRIEVHQMLLIWFFTLTVFSFINCKVLPLSCKQIREFVDGHNARRLLIAEGKVSGHPAASEMKKVVWDDELYKKAVEWADRLEKTGRGNSHNPDKTIPSGRFTTSENLLWYSTTDPNYSLMLENVLDSWFNEHKYYTFGSLNTGHFAGGKDVGHYTQMVWSDTIYLGCAISKKLKNGWHNYFVVCNYGPQGNYIGRKPYTATGKASSSLICHHEQCQHPYGKRCATKQHTRKDKE